MVCALVPGLNCPLSSPGRGYCVVFLGDTSFSVLLSAREYKSVAVNCWGNLTNCGGVEILLATSSYRNQNKLGSYDPEARRIHFF